MPVMERITSNYRNLSQKFSQQNSNYNKQYCSIYLIRLKQMEVLLMEQITKKWGSKYTICKLHKLTERENEKCIVIGTLFKNQKLKPSILKQLGEANQLVPQPILTHFTDDSDVLFIEDELQRYEIIGADIDISKLVTGITCAFLGNDIGNGRVLVDDIIFAGYRPQIERPIPTCDNFVVFLSGLDCVNYNRNIVSLDLLANWLCGTFEENRNISRVIIAGNSVRTIRDIPKATISMTSKTVESKETIEAVQTLDQFLHPLCMVMDVDLMPGENDPSNHILPQKPMHRCMFPNSYKLKSFNQVSNPYNCSVDDTLIFGTSGQNVRDILRFSEITDPLDALEACLRWNHVAPTAPDTLGCFPFYESDPFIIEDCPHVFFAGNQSEFATKIVEGVDGQTVRLISVPEFTSSLQAVVLNLRNLDCYTVEFKIVE